MRKILSKEEEAKKQRTKQFIVGGILIFVMLFSTLGFAFQGKSSDKESKITHNGFEFSSQGGYWRLDIENLNFIFKNNPTQIPRIYSIINSLENYVGKPLYVYSESNDAQLEIYRNLDPRNNPIIQRIQPACPEDDSLNMPNKTCEENSPLKNCEENLIIIREDNHTQIIQNENCVIIQSPKANLTKTTDEFLFKLFGIV